MVWLVAQQQVAATESHLFVVPHQGQKMKEFLRYWYLLKNKIIYITRIFDIYILKRILCLTFTIDFIKWIYVCKNQLAATFCCIIFILNLDPSFEWRDSCLFRWSDLMKAFPQNLHTNFLIPVWTLLWRDNSSLLENKIFQFKVSCCHNPSLSPKYEYKVQV